MARCLLALVLIFGCDDGGGDSDAGPGGEADAGVPACSDGLDNDGDGLIDGFDPSCSGPNDPTEEDRQCSDGADNDEDGATDLDDRGCEDAEDDDESDEPPLPQCQNELDDDEDGFVDLDDRGCEDADDDDESGEPDLPECSDGIDNDEDQLIDFPRDPGCASEVDEDEGGQVDPIAQCGDGIDNDLDGFVDLADPGCETGFDPIERNGAERAACANGVDDDADGLADFPYDPGCRAAGDDDEEDEGARACGNGLDDDNDGRVDFPDDPGCAGIGDGDENDPPVVPACADGRDNDRDGTIDYPDDIGCDSASDSDEAGNCAGAFDAIELTSGRRISGDTRGAPVEAEGSCGGRGAAEVVFVVRIDRVVEAFEVRTDFPETELETTLYVRRACLGEASEVACVKEPTGDGEAGNRVRVDNPTPGTYFVFLDGAGRSGGAFTAQLDIVPLAACLNGVDDDDDGRVDYPNDPGCSRASDRDEADPAEAPTCSNGQDDDGDDRVDYPADPGCASAADPDEVDLCGAGVRVLEYPVGNPFVLDDTRRGTTAFQGSCGGNNAPELVYRYENPFSATLEFSVDHPETIGNTVVYARSRCVDTRSELGCDDGDEGARGVLRLERQPPGEVFVFVDHRIGQGGPVKLSVRVTRLDPGCSDQIDNDDDGFIDLDDLGCADPEDESEADPAQAPVCRDGLDNDGDGLIDYPFDPGCGAAGDGDEADPEVLPACFDGVDNDGDGAIDFPADEGCSATGDDEEERRRPGQCANSIDDDMDGLADYPFDPGCSAPGDLSETDDQLEPACANEIDDDRDGLVDFPFDPGCLAAGHRTEVDPDPPRACSNGLDDDGDGVIDFPAEPGCQYAADDDEANGVVRPRCSNGNDDDNNGRTDWPDDPGCSFAADNTEDNSGPTRRRCADGVDNDLDGAVDLADRGCAGANDDDEDDPEVQPWCADGIDNDEDGIIDWPMDEGCAARGDACEQEGFGLCEGECLDIRVDAENCGRCGRVCDDGVECINGFCGGLFTFEGVRRDVSPIDLEGWELCHLDTYNERNTTVADVVARCDGEYVMLGCRPVNAATWQLAAMGERDEVFFDTGSGRENADNTHPHNGVEWYFSPEWSIGFAPLGQRVNRNSCDVENGQADQRLCWHTSGGRLNSGYRCGQWTGAGGQQSYERAVWTSR